MGLFGAEKKEKKHEPVVMRELPPPLPVDRPPPVARPEAQAEPAAPAYGIDRAIELMRGLPEDEEKLELVVHVIRSTLASTKVSVEAIIEDATRKQERIQRRVAKLAEEIVGLEKEIEKRREETLSLQQDYDETTKVKARLSLGFGVATEVVAMNSEANEGAVEPTPPEGTPLSSAS